MSKTIGIDLGTTNSCVAVFEHGDASVLENAEGARTTPSVVSFKEDGERTVGAVAYRQAVINPENTVSSIKRFMGRKYSEVSEEETIVPYRVHAGEDDSVLIHAAGKDYKPQEISAMILQKLKADAEAKTGESVDSAVITVPAYFNDDQRQATKDAGRIAGLNVLRIINEPTAAALAYGLDKQSEEERILVFDLGGGTFDVSVLEIADSVFEVLSTSGDNHLGGDNWDAAIVRWLTAEFLRDQGVDLAQDKNALQRLYEAAEKAKIELSSAQDTSINLPFITAVDGQPKHLEIKLTRSRFEDLTSDLLDRVVEPVEAALLDAGNPTIDHVVLVGGMTRMPAVRDKVKSLTGSEPHQGVNPDEVVALGAAIQAGVLQGDVSDVLLLDVTPLSLGLETKGGIMTTLIPRNTTIPTNKSEVFSTAEDNQSSVEIHVGQGERSLIADNKSLGRFELQDIPPAPRGVPQIEVSFDLNVDGLLTVSAKDLATGKNQTLEVKGGGGLSDEEITQMIQDAEKYSEEDKMRKVFAESINSAEAVLYRAEKDEEEREETFDIPEEFQNKVDATKQELLTTLEKAKNVSNVAGMAETAKDLNSKNSLYQTALADYNAAIFDTKAKQVKEENEKEDIIDAEIVEDDEPKVEEAENKASDSPEEKPAKEESDPESSS